MNNEAKLGSSEVCETNAELREPVGVTETLQYLFDRNRPRFDIMPDEKETPCET